MNEAPNAACLVETCYIRINHDKMKVVMACYCYIKKIKLHENISQFIITHHLAKSC